MRRAAARHQGHHVATRSFGLRVSTARDSDRSVEAVLVTESPVWVMDWERWEPVREVLTIPGLVALPEQLPLLDSHHRSRVGDQLGSTRGMRVEDGGELGQIIVGRRYLGRQQSARDAYEMIQDGHLTDGSIGYEILEYRTLREGESAEVDGRVYRNDSPEPLRLVTTWRLMEDSLTPVGADSAAKVRDHHHHNSPGRVPGRQKESTVNKAFKRWLRARGQNYETLSEERRSALLDQFRGWCIARGYIGQSGGVRDLTDGQISEIEALDDAALVEDGGGHQEPDLGRQAPQRSAPPSGQDGGQGGGSADPQRSQPSPDTIELHARRQIADANISLGADFDYRQFGSLEAVNGFVLGARAQAQRSEPAVPVGGAVVTSDGRERRCRAAVDAIAAMGGVRGAEDLGMRRLRPTEVVREIISAFEPQVGARMSHEDVCCFAGNRDFGRLSLRSPNQVAATFSTILADASQLVAMEGFRQANVTNRRWTRSRFVDDFRTVEGAGVIAGMLAEQEAPGAPFNEARMLEQSYSAKLGLFGRSFSFAYTDWRNDSLGEQLATVRNYGMIAGVTEDYLSYKAALAIAFSSLSQVQSTAAFWDDTNDRVKLQGLGKVMGALEGRTVTVGDEKIPLSPVASFVLVPPLRKAAALAATGTAPGQQAANDMAESLQVISSPWMGNTAIGGHADDYIVGAGNLDGVVVLRDRLNPEPVVWEVGPGRTPDKAFVVMHAVRPTVAYAGAFEKGDWS
jgi:hypothetical protein